MASKADYFVTVTGDEELRWALNKAARELRNTDKRAEIYKLGPRIVKRVAIPEIKLEASRHTPGVPPQAHITAQNVKAKAGRYPKMEFENKAGAFRDKRSKKDANRYGAIYWGSLFGDKYNTTRFGGPAAQWVDRVTRRITPRVHHEYRKGTAELLRKAKLL